MKTKLLLFAMFLVLTSIGAQVRIGAFGGMTNGIYKVKGFYTDLKGRMSPNFGAICEVNITDQFFFDARILYKKLSSDGNSVEAMENINFELSFLEFPITLKYEFVQHLKPYFLMGINVQYYLSSDFGFRMNGEYYSGELNERINEIDLNLLIGFGMNINLSETIVFLEGNYSIGVNNKLNKGKFVVINGAREFTELIESDYLIKIRNFNLVVGVMIPIIL